MNSDFLKDVISAEKTKHDATTALEHEAIILRFQQTGCLDREDAIKKYKEFNDDHPEYYMAMSVATKTAGTAAYIGDVSGRTIVENLQKQLLFLAGKKLSEGANHAKPTT